MKILMELFVVITFLGNASLCYSDPGTTFKLGSEDFKSTAIIVTEANDAVSQFAAMELQKHLSLITGYEFPIKKSDEGYQKRFYVGIPSPDDNISLETEECRYVISDDAVYLYGEDEILIGSGEYAVVRRPELNRTGTLFAVYLFLENELNVRWIEPGDQGICYEPMNEIVLAYKHKSWRSPFRYARGIRTYAWRGSWGKDSAVPEEFQYSEDEAKQNWFEYDLWKRRMRLGNRSGVRLFFGHAFTKWWEKYGKTHPEFFALTNQGKREPISLEKPDRVKMCVSNPDFIKEVVRDYVEKRKQNNALFFALDATENDGGPGGVGQYCHCENCRALDVLLEGEEFGDHLTDRYVYFYNECLKEARKYFPDAQVDGFIYSTPTYKPPRKQRVAEGVNLQVVPTMAVPFSETRKLYEDWKQAGATSLLYRPNDLCVDFGLPMGHEKRIFQAQQLGIEYGAQGFDHDSLYGFWTGISGITYYVVAKSISDPTKSFEYWEDEYLSVYGDARDDVKRYFQYWRDVFNTRLLPADHKVRKSGGKLLQWRVVGGFGSQVENYYKEEDFRRTDGFLQDALSRDITEQQRRQIERLVVANKHNHLTFEASAALASGDIILQMKKAKELVDFRIRNRDILKMNWYRLFRAQAEYGLEANSLAKQYDELIVRGFDPEKPLNFGDNLLENSNFQAGLEGWQVTLWRESEGSSGYSGRDIEVVDSHDQDIGKYLRVKIHDQDFYGIYVLNQSVSVTEGESYILRFRWRRVNPRESSDFGVVKSENSLRYPRYGLMFYDQSGEVLKSVWGDASKKDENTDWIRQVRIFPVGEGSGIVRVAITFFFASEGENHLDEVELLKF